MYSSVIALYYYQMMDFANPLSSIPNRKIALTENLGTLIFLRWLAVGGVGLSLVVAYFLGLNLPWETHLRLLVLLAGLNAAYLLWHRYIATAEIVADDPQKGDRPPYQLLALLFVQIATDWLLLTAFLHFAGGLLNPFVFLYVLHMIIAAGLIHMNIGVTLTAFGVGLISAVSFLELNGRLGFQAVNGLPSVRDMDIRMLFAYLLVLTFVLFSTYRVTYFLVSRIRERETKLYEMSSELVALSNLRSEFLFRVTHELKSPVAAMMSAVDAVLALSGECLAAPGKDILERMRRRGEGLLSLIKDLLEIARLSSPSFTREVHPVEPAGLLAGIIEMEELKAAERGISLKSTVGVEPPKVLADESALREVFSNLVSNAIRYTPYRGSVEVFLTGQGDKISFAVSDTGIGISDEDQKKLFGEFFRASNAKKFSPAGTGLGLAITKTHVERMGGSISVKSKLGEGTTFTVVLPAYKE
ncbi:MAG: HAMP domain-containing sensor histidine kinase [Candidatus Brocadiia bacterium]